MVAVAASAGGVEALSAFVASLPADFRAAVLVVLHIPPAGTSVLPKILSRAGKLPARHPRDGDPLAGGAVLVAPPDRHLAVAGASARVSAGPKENGHRPAADVLMRSVAQNFGSRSAGVVLSGTMDDGAAGLRAIRAVGGLALVQDPEEAAFPHMPAAAIDEAGPEVVAPVAELVERLCAWVGKLPEMPPEKLSPEAVMGAGNPGLLGTDPAPMTCPECGGTLWLHNEYGAYRFRCRVGHAFSPNGLLVGKQTVLERALWAAVVALEERADLSRRILRRLEQGGRAAHVARYRDDIANAEGRARFLRDMIRDLVQEARVPYDEADGADAPA